MTNIRKLYIGWVRGGEEDLERLHSLGVWGPMICDEERGTISHCWVNDEEILGALNEGDIHHFTLAEGPLLKKYLAEHIYYLCWLDREGER